MSESQNYSGNEFHTDLDFDTMITHPNSNEYEILCYFPETIIVVKDMWVRVNGLDNVMPIRTGLSREGTNHYREIEFSLKHNILFNQEAHKKLEQFLRKQNCIAHGNSFNIANTELLTRNNFSLVALPPPAIPRLNSGTGSRNSSAKNTYTDQEIASMSATHRVAHMLYLALSKMNVAIADLFTVEDLLMVAALLLVLQVTPEGWALDAALLGMAFAYAWFDGIKAVSMLVKAVSMAASANNNTKIDQAATLAAKGAVHLGLDLIIAFVVHKQIGTGEGIAVTPGKAKLEPKENIKDDDYVKTDLGEKPALKKIEEVTAKEFTPLGLSNAESMKVLNSPMGEKMMEQYANSHPDWTMDRIQRTVLQGIQSGDTIPVEVNNFTGKILKIQSADYAGISPNTIYFTTPSELEKAVKIAANGGEGIAQQFGLPSGSVLDQYNIMGMEAKNPTTIFTSRVAPTIEDGVKTLGGATQNLIYDQTQFNALGKLGTITNNGVIGK